jgi:hypothetical protein
MSELSNRYIKDSSEAAKTGQIVKVLSVDTKAKRIELSIWALSAIAPRPIARIVARICKSPLIGSRYVSRISAPEISDYRWIQWKDPVHD